MTMWSRKITLTRAPQGSSEYMYFFCFSFFLLLSNFGYGKCTNLITVEFDLLQNNCLGINFALIVRIGSDEYTYSIPVHQNGDSNHFEMDHIQIFSSDSVQFLWTYCYSPDTNESCCWTVDNARTSSFDIATLPTTNRVESCSSKNLEFSMDGKYSFQSKCSYKNLDIDLSNPPKTEDCSNMDDVIEISSCVFATSTASTFFPTTNVRYTTHTITHGITSSSVLLATPLPATELPSKDCEGDGKVWMTTVSGSNSTGINYCHNGITNGTRQCRENGTWDSPYCTSLIEIAKNMTGRSLEERIDFLLLISNILPEDETVTLLPILENVLNFASQLNATNQTIQNVSVTSLQILVNVVNFASQSKLTDQNFSVLSLQILENLLNFVSHSNPTNRIIQNVSETSLRILESLLNFTSQSNPTEQIIQNVTVSSVQILVNLVNFASQSNPTDQNFSVLSLQLLENLLNFVSHSNPTNRIIQNVSETSLRILESLLNFTSQSNPTEQIIQNVTVSSVQILVNLVNFASQSNPIDQNFSVLSLQLLENLLNFVSHSNPTDQIIQNVSETSLRILESLLNFTSQSNPTEQIIQNVTVTSLQILVNLVNFASQSNPIDQNFSVLSLQLLENLLNLVSYSNPTNRIIQNVSETSLRILESLLNFTSQSNPTEQIIQNVTVSSEQILVKLLNLALQSNPTQQIIQNVTVLSLQVFENLLSFASQSSPTQQIMQRMSVSSLETLKNLLNFAPNLNPNEQKVQKLLVTSLQIHMLEELLNFESRSNTTEQNTLVSSFPILVSLLNSTMQSNLTEHIIQNVSVISVQILENLLNFASQSNTDQQIVQEVSVLSLGILVNLLNFTSQVNPTRLIIQNASMSSLQILDNSLSSFSPSFTAEQITPEVLMIATLIVSFYGSQTDQALTTQYKDERYNVSSRLVLILDNFGKLLEQYSHMICIEDYCIGINVTEVQNPLQDEITVLSINGNSVNIFLHPELWNTVESVRIIALYYSNISFLLKPQNTTEMILPQVLSAFIDCQTCDTLQNIVENVTIQFNISKVFSDDFQIDDFEITCVFFKFTDERYFAGIWESTGCSTQVVGNTSVICTCDHLTHFAILLSPRATFSDTDTKILTTVGLVIVSISLVCMVAVAFIYIVFKSLWNMRTYIHIMLCISLFAAQLLFVIGIDRTKNKGVCSAIAVTLQYLFLVAFMWMLMEGLVLYVSLSQVFIKNTKCYLIGFTTASYGIPVIYMAIVAPTGYLVHTEDLYENTHYLYQNGSACWLSDESGFIWSFISPVILILLLNICFFVMTLFVMKKHEKKVHGKHAARRWLRVSVSLTAVMGVTWLGGLLVINELEIFAYVMVPVLTSQGLLIFIVLVPLSRQVRQAILQMLRKKFPHSRILHSNGFFLFSSNQKRKVENPSKNRVVMGTFGERSFSTPNNQLDNLGENISFKTKESSVTISEESSAMECQTVILHMD